MEFERYDDGVPSWVDLGSTDLAKSREFYGACSAGNAPRDRPRPVAIPCATWAGRPWPGSARR